MSLQVHLIPPSQLSAALLTQKACLSTRPQQEQQSSDRFWMRMHMPCGMNRVPAMLFRACDFISMHHGMRGGSRPRVLRTADFATEIGGSQKARLEAPGSRRDARSSCIHRSSCHGQCTCNMPCRARACGARVRPVSIPRPAWQPPGRLLGGTNQFLFSFCMQPFLHAIHHPCWYSCHMPCTKRVRMQCVCRVCVCVWLL